MAAGFLIFVIKTLFYYEIYSCREKSFKYLYYKIELKTFYGRSRIYRYFIGPREILSDLSDMPTNLGKTELRCQKLEN